MSRYTTPTGPEAEYESGSRQRVLSNRLGVKSRMVMDRLEAEALVAVQKRYFTEGMVTEETSFTVDSICQMHREWLGGIYEWAGCYRTVELSKGEFTFPPARLVRENMLSFQQGFLAEFTPCRPQDIRAVCQAVAKVHAELLLVHPFREGNGRLARWLANIMFAQAGMTIPDYGFVGRGALARRKYYLGAVIRGYYQDYSDLARFFEEALARGYATDLRFDSERGSAPSNTDDS